MGSGAKCTNWDSLGHLGVDMVQLLQRTAEVSARHSAFLHANYARSNQWQSDACILDWFLSSIEYTFLTLFVM